MPKSLVPLRYLSACFTASMWPGDGLDWCCANRLTMTAMSGLVPCKSQRRDPT